MAYCIEDWVSLGYRILRDGATCCHFKTLYEAAEKWVAENEARRNAEARVVAMEEALRPIIRLLGLIEPSEQARAAVLLAAEWRDKHAAERQRLMTAEGECANLRMRLENRAESASRLPQ